MKSYDDLVAEIKVKDALIEEFTAKYGRMSESFTKAAEIQGAQARWIRKLERTINPFYDVEGLKEQHAAEEKLGKFV